MAKFLTEVGMSPTIPEGGYFMVANWTALENKVKLNEETDTYKDYRFTKWMTKNVGVQGIPPSAFYSEEHKHLGEDNVRYCFIKVHWRICSNFSFHSNILNCTFILNRLQQDENLKKAADILMKWKSQQ